MFEIIRLVLLGGTILLGVFLVLLALPRSHPRQIVLPVIGFAISALSVVFIVAPIEVRPKILLGPFRFADDLVALAVAVGSALKAIDARKEAG